MLARVTNDLDEPRGPDVLHAVEVPMEWLEEGANIEVMLPRLLTCARCEGGGCDACGRKGAFEQAGGAQPVVVSLPLVSLQKQKERGSAPTALRLRLPGYGAPGPAESELPPGHLLLTVVPRDAAFGWAPASSVQKLAPPESVRTPRHQTTALWALALGLTSLLWWWLGK